MNLPLKIVAVALTCGAMSNAVLAAPFVAPRDPQCVAYSPQGSLVALGFSGMDNGEFPPRPHPDVRKCGCVQIRDALTGQRLRRIETFGDLVDLRFSPDGKYLAAARLFANAEGLELHEVRVWTVADGKTAHVFDRCHAFAFAPHGSRLVVLGRKRCVEFELGSGDRQQTLPELDGAIACAYVDADRLVGTVRREAAAAGENGDSHYALRLISRNSGERLAESPPLPEPCYHLALSPDGVSLATGFSAGVVVLWNVAELKPLGKLEMGTRGIAHPFFDPAGERLAAGDQATGDVVIWELTGGRETQRYTFEKGSFRPHYVRAETAVERPERDPARFVFSPDGEAFLSGCYGGIVRLVSSGQDVRRFAD